MAEARIAISNPSGLHARPAALFVRAASGFKSSIRVRNLSRGGKEADARSLLSLMALGIAAGHEIVIRAEGPDEEQAVECLRQLLEHIDEEPG